MQGHGLAVEAANLTKVFGATRAVDGLDLAVPLGSVYGFLGPNGAGKTTALRMLATLLRPDAGAARVLGHDLAADGQAIRRRIALTGQFASLDPDLTGRENLVLLARLLGRTRAAARGRAVELLDDFDLTEAADRQVKRYSGGMRRRLDIAASLIRKPDLLFLDEPTTGLDPRSRNQVWETIRGLSVAGTTVLLTTQYLDEADQLADRIGVIDRGRLIAEGSSGELKASVGSGTLRVRIRDRHQRPLAAQVLDSVLDVPVFLGADPVELSAQPGQNGTGPGERAARALAELADRGVVVTDFALGQPSLDEVFLALTGHPAATSETTDGSRPATPGAEDAA